MNLREGENTLDVEWATHWKKRKGDVTPRQTSREYMELPRDFSWARIVDNEYTILFFTGDWVIKVLKPKQDDNVGFTYVNFEDSETRRKLLLEMLEEYRFYASDENTIPGLVPCSVYEIEGQGIDLTVRGKVMKNPRLEDLDSRYEYGLVMRKLPAEPADFFEGKPLPERKSSVIAGIETALDLAPFGRVAKKCLDEIIRVQFKQYVGVYSPEQERQFKFYGSKEGLEMKHKDNEKWAALVLETHLRNRLGKVLDNDERKRIENLLVTNSIWWEEIPRVVFSGHYLEEINLRVENDNIRKTHGDLTAENLLVNCFSIYPAETPIYYMVGEPERIQILDPLIGARPQFKHMDLVADTAMFIADFHANIAAGFEENLEYALSDPYADPYLSRCLPPKNSVYAKLFMVEDMRERELRLRKHIAYETNLLKSSIRNYYLGRAPWSTGSNLIFDYYLAEKYMVRAKNYIDDQKKFLLGEICIAAAGDSIRDIYTNFRQWQR